MRQVDTVEYLSILRQLVREGKLVNLPVAGNSMLPFLADGRDAVWFRTPDRPLKAGDVVFYQRKTGQFVMHRILRVRPEGYYLAGDAQSEVEGPLEAERIFGLVTQVRRKGKILTPKNPEWWFYAGIWRRMGRLKQPVMAGWAKIKGRQVQPRGQNK